MTASRLACAAVALWMLGSLTQAQSLPLDCHGVCRDPGHPEKPLITRPGDRDRGDCPPLRYRMDDCERAGHPHCYHRWAKCGVDGKYSAWFVGGGAALPFGRPRTASEGTWGLDYGGLFGHAKVWMNYTHGRNQGGVGAIEPMGSRRSSAGFTTCSISGTSKKFRAIRWTLPTFRDGSNDGSDCCDSCYCFLAFRLASNRRSV